MSTLALDALKGALPVLLVSRLVGGGIATGVAAFAAVLGHCYPVWLRFKGGKGVATFLGGMSVLAWPVGLPLFVSVFIVALAVTRVVSVASLLAAAAVPVGALVSGDRTTALAAAAMALVVLVRHRPNLQRLVRGQEPRVGARRRLAS